jgi:diguanylate cyclase (GGDEF)-like protein
LSNATLLFAVLAFQQALVLGSWLIAARLRLARAAALHWAASAALIVLAMGLLLSRPTLDPWLSVVGANVVLTLALVAIWRGVRVFSRQPFDDTEIITLVGVGTLLFMLAHSADRGMVPVVMANALVMSWALLRAAWDMRKGLGDEIGITGASWCALPLAVVGIMLATRGVLAPLMPEHFGRGIEADVPVNVGVVFATMGFAIVLNMALTALVVMRLVRKLQYQSDHDALTGLLSRRPLQERLQLEAERLHRYGSGYAMLSVDIDHFKRINDERGHAAGDAVLVRVAQTLRSVARQVDSVARMGGEEFCVLLPESDRRCAQAVAMRVLEAVRMLEHPELGPGARVTVSVGLAVVASPVESPQALLRRLDRALYRAKSDGRNRVVEAESTADTTGSAAR